MEWEQKQLRIDLIHHWLAVHADGDQLQELLDEMGGDENLVTTQPSEEEVEANLAALAKLFG